MMKLTHEAFEKARAFVHEQARPLERCLFSYYFREGSAEDVFAELAKYQNSDGGFGNALEPDVRLPDSSAIATTIGLQILRELKASENHPIVRGVIRYLLDTYDSEYEVWQIIPSNANEAPYAPWWQYTEDLAKQWGEFLANPRAEIVGYFYDYSELVPTNLLDRLTIAVVSHLDSLPDSMEMHELLCYVRLAETQTLPKNARTKIIQKLRQAVDCVVAKEPSDWEKYGLKPLTVVASPDSPFAAMLTKEIDLNLDYEIDHQREDGSWTLNWSWGDTFPEEWKNSEREWKGVLTVRALRVFQNFDRLE